MGCDTSNTISLADWLVAIGTILLAFIAVFQDKIRGYFQRPNLECDIELSPPDCHRTIMKMRDSDVSFYVFYYLFKIWNKGNISAKNVEVIISDVQKKEGAVFKSIDGFLPGNLKWSFLGGKTYCDYISPDTFKHCNLGHILDPQHRHLLPDENNPSLPVQANETIFCFDVEFRSNRLYYLVTPGTYKFKITIGCENAKPATKTYIIDVTGKWWEDESRMLNEGFTIRETP
jgi:hypothetical protein